MHEHMRQADLLCRNQPAAVKTMARVQLGATLGDKEVSDIVAFLGSLTGPLPKGFATSPVLPPEH
jgi:cytochrome c peroxidase